MFQKYLIGLFAITGTLQLQAATYTSFYEQLPRDHSLVVDRGSTHTFEVDNCPTGYHVEWYITYSGGSPVDSDTVIAPFDPDFDRSFSSPGTAWVRAEVYDSDWNWEEAHRWEVTVGAPDLIVEDIWLDPSTAVVGEPYVIYARIMNIGDIVANVPIGSQQVRFFVNGSPADSDSYDNLAPGESVVVQTSTLTVPSGSSFSVRAEADYADDVDEESESNNDRTELFSSNPPPLPDLVITGLSVSSPVGVGEMYSVNLTVANIGTAAAGPSRVGIYINGSPTVLTMSVNSIAPGATRTAFSSEEAPVEEGVYQLRAKADVYDAVVESNEDNNWSPVDWLQVIPLLSDLVVEDITVTPGYAWRPSTVTAIIRNQGTATAEFGLFDRVCRFEVDGQVDYDTALLHVTIPPGGSYAAEETFTIDEVGSYDVTALVDPENEIAEESEGNNSRTESETWIASTIHDTDYDGMIDADEVVAGSLPDNGSNIWKCATISTNSDFILTWPSISNRWYAVERTLNLTNDFVVIASNLPATPPENSWLDTTASNAFYRIEVSEAQW